MRIGSAPRIVPGQRFRRADPDRFGQNRREWEVVHVGRGADGRPSAHLVAVGDQTVSKTLAIDALLDRRLYEVSGPVPQAPR